MALDFLKRHRIAALAVVLAAFFSQAPAQAAPMVSFDDDAFPTSGTVSHTAGGTAVGTDITFFSVIGLDTPINNGVRLDCVDCLMNFETGTVISEGSSAPGDGWTFGPGGSITIEGSLVDGGGGTVAIGTLLSGSFSDASVSGSGNSLTFDGFGIDSKHPDLLAYWGITADDFDFVNTTISLGNVSFNGANFQASVVNADLDNLARVPSPATLMLFGMSLIGLGALTRWKVYTA